MRICLILEGCYPYITGGVSTWVHQYMQAMPQHEFVIWAIGADSKDKGKFKYKLPQNVVEVKEVFLNDALKIGYERQKHRFSQKELSALKDVVSGNNPDWETLFDLYQVHKLSPIAFLMSHEYLDLLTETCIEEYPYTAFSDLFHTVRSMLLPLLYILHSEVPKADLYHSIATGYSGVLARLGGYLNHVPYMITEHGIYTREREEEIIRAKWVLPAFKRLWVRFFYMLSDGAYEKATSITSLFEHAMEIQIEMGCDRNKCRYIPNGIHYDRFADIPLKPDNGYVDIGAVLRIAPIKDVKTMLYAFSALKQRIPNARLHICGPEDDKKYAQECYDLARALKLKDVFFPGTVDVLTYMVHFDFTILTSISEGLPLSVLESFAAARPAVVTDVGGCRGLIYGMEGDELGPAGFCVPPMQRDALCGAMETLCAKPELRYKMGTAAKERVRRYYQHGDMIRNYLNAYAEVFKRWQESDSVSKGYSTKKEFSPYAGLTDTRV